MSGFFDKLKDVGKDALGTFVVLDENGNEQPAERPAAGGAAQPRTASGASPSPAGAGAPAGPAAVPVSAIAPDPEFVQQLHAACDGSKKAAYGHFRVLFGALSAVADEAQRTQLALAAAQASHKIGPAEVAAAIDDRLRILAEEKSAFDNAVQAEVEHTVGATQAEIDKARAEIVKKTEEIQALAARAAELEKQVHEATAALDANSARFAASYAAVEAELAAERARIAPFATPTR